MEWAGLGWVWWDWVGLGGRWVGRLMVWAIRDPACVDAWGLVRDAMGHARGMRRDGRGVRVGRGGAQAGRTLRQAWDGVGWRGIGVGLAWDRRGMGVG